MKTEANETERWKGMRSHSDEKNIKDEGWEGREYIRQ